jgi:lipopolysaccharide transport system ATP-binding protein
MDVYLYFEAKRGFRGDQVTAGLKFETQLGVPVFLQHNKLTGDEFNDLPNSGAFVCRIPRLPLPPSTYRITYSIRAEDGYLDAINDAAQLTVVEGDFFASGRVPPISHGVCLVDGEWFLRRESAY